MFFNWHCIEIFAVPTRQREELFLQVPSLFSSLDGSRLWFALTQIVFTHHSSLGLLIEWHSLLLLIAFNEHFVYALMSFFSSALLGKPVDATHNFGGVTSLVESGVLLPLPSGVQAFVSELGLFSVLRGSQFHDRQAHLAYYRRLEVDCNDETCDV